MVQIVKWYLASFHAGRKSAVAKKPYNPVLGEIFRCHWDLPDTSSDDEVVADGPVPWCHRNQLTFIAEQVSHHPPISAFYAEHVNRRVSLCAHVWTKSKFLGLSIGVHNVGFGTLKLLQFGEEYVCTFPNGYGRSILTVPWIELGGSTTVKCVQSGYHANVEFHTKPFYGGKKHRITAENEAHNQAQNNNQDNEGHNVNNEGQNVHYNEDNPPHNLHNNQVTKRTFTIIKITKTFTIIKLRTFTIC
ncbi:oxysterol-binding protein-related protein 9-like [Diaphorina citri]|uniref:Oxysterol-binding protein n=1 Tax=Diaphorina citri TaxID=121845 RepID=A0A3Q0J136_DIACI|nr:oxysterol-binding protein-related protein 9-like [Diaphorina citri]